MEDFWRPVIKEEYSVVRQPSIEENNFELKPTLITMVQQHRFTGHLSEDPNEHLGKFLRMANIVKLNGVNPDVMKLQLFHFSLRDIAASWFKSLSYGSVNYWEELVETYLSRFFPLALTCERKGEIITFKQKEYELLYNAWERYKKLLRRCPMHGIEQMTQMDIFYHAMNYTLKGTLDAASRGAFRRKSDEEATQLIEELAKSNYRAPSEASGSSSKLRGSEVIEFNKMPVIETKLDAIMNRMNNQKRRGHSCNKVGTVKEVEQKSIAEQGLAHEGPYNVEEAQYIRKRIIIQKAVRKSKA